MSASYNPTPMGGADTKRQTFGKLIEIVSLNLLRFRLGGGTEAFGEA